MQCDINIYYTRNKLSQIKSPESMRKENFVDVINSLISPFLRPSRGRWRGHRSIVSSSCGSPPPQVTRVNIKQIMHVFNIYREFFAFLYFLQNNPPIPQLSGLATTRVWKVSQMRMKSIMTIMRIEDEKSTNAAEVSVWNVKKYIYILNLCEPMLRYL